MSDNDLVNSINKELLNYSAVSKAHIEKKKNEKNSRIKILLLSKIKEIKCLFRK